MIFVGAFLLGIKQEKYFLKTEFNTFRCDKTARGFSAM